jgi:hypothetical protein
MITFLITMFSASQDRSKLSAIFVFLAIVCLLLFAVYLKAQPEIVKVSSGHISSHVKIWADPNESLASKLKTISLWSIIFLFSALVITPDISSPLGLILMREVAPPNLFFGSRCWSRPPPAI